jgi:hypothetical protein
VYEPCFGSGLDAVAGLVLHVFRQVFVNAQRNLSPIYLNTEVLVKLIPFGWLEVFVLDGIYEVQLACL